MSNTRIEKDSMGQLEVDKGALYGAQTQRALNNFSVSQQTLPTAFIQGLLMIKQAAAKANKNLQLLPNDMADAIQEAAVTLLRDEHLMQHFPVDIFQTGSGTSSNMNANEVLANLASQQSGIEINPNDHVNYGQSSNDVIPTCIQVSATLEIKHKLLPALQYLKDSIDTKAESVRHLVKTGRTHLMDAMPVTMDQALKSWSSQIEMNITHIQALLPSLQQLPQGGTAVGTGINAHPKFADYFNKALTGISGVIFTPADNFFSRIGNQDVSVAVSGQLKTTAVSIMKIANDLRWMNSGPLAGLGEIELEPLQPGSSIMPGKVNPVIPESAAMAAAQVMGNDTAITIGGQSGNFELNVMLPMIGANLLQSIHLLTSVSHMLADKAISSFKVNEQQLQQALAKNPILVTALNPVIGYSKAAEIAKQAYKEGRPVIDVAAEQTTISREELSILLDPVKLTAGGIGDMQ